MPSPYPTDTELLRAEIAAAAARMIAEDGADYGSAKRRAARQILGNARVPGSAMPDNAQVEQEVRQYNQLFFGDSQPARLARLRGIALDVMQRLEQFAPYLTGAVLNGTAGPHSDIHLQLFVDSPKEVEIHLLNLGIDFEVSEAGGAGRENPAEILSFMYLGEGVHLALYDAHQLRRLGKTDPARPERADAAALGTLITEDDAK